MKKLSYLTVFAVVFLWSANFATASSARSEFRNYEINAVDDIYLGKQVEAVWQLSYSHDGNPVTVVKRHTLEGTVYLVQSRFFSVSYVSNFYGFGVKETRKSWTKVPREISRAVICQKEMARQEVITPKRVDDETALGLIASYLPDLINDGYTHVLN